jgi:hypothetical protein
MHSRQARRGALLLLVCLLIPACATWRGPDADEILAGLPAESTLSDVPFHPQTQYHCGPAALATVLQHNQVDTSPEALVSWVYVPERFGSLQAEMLAATRRHGLVAYRLPPDPSALFSEVAAGHPVLVLENLGLVRAPIWHYAVIIGYSADSAELIQHSGTTRALRQPMRRWLRSWQRGGQWAMLALRPGQLPAGDDPAGWIRAVADFEAHSDDPDAARTAWAATLQRWPDQPLAWFGLGNSHAALHDWSAAEAAFEETLALTPEHGPARYNLAQLAMLQNEPCRAVPLLEVLGEDGPLGSRASQDLIRARKACALTRNPPRP